MTFEIIYKAFAYESRDERHFCVTSTVYEELSQERSDTPLITLLLCLATITFVKLKENTVLYFLMQHAYLNTLFGGQWVSITIRTS
jgi:hypothetical protein